MDKKTSFLFLFLILSLGLVSSVEISIKDSVKLQENFIIKVSGTFVKPLTEKNIMFYRINSLGAEVKTSLGFYDLEKIQGDYYFYLEIPENKEPGEYIISLENIEYKIGNNIYDKEVEKNFSIESNKAPFSIYPPFKVLEETEDVYEIEILNLMSKTIEVGLERNIKTTKELKEESSESGGFFDSLFGLFSKKEEVENETENITILTEIEFPEKITLKPGEAKKIRQNSPKKEGFEKIDLYYEDEIYGILVYNPVDRKEFIIDDEKKDDIKNETIQNQTGDSNYTLENKTVLNETIQNQTEEKNITETNKTNSDGVKSCLAAGGKICKPNEEICKDADIKYTKGVRCCMSECEKKIEKNNNKLIGWGIIIVIAGFAAWFFKTRYRKAIPEKIDLTKIGNK